MNLEPDFDFIKGRRKRSNAFHCLSDEDPETKVIWANSLQFNPYQKAVTKNTKPLQSVPTLESCISNQDKITQLPESLSFSKSNEEPTIFEE